MSRNDNDNPFAGLDKSRFPKDKASKERAERERQAQARAARTRQREETPSAADEENMFASAMAGVTPLDGARGRDVPPAAPERKNDTNPSLVDMDSRQALHDLVNGKIQFELHFTDEYIQAHVSGMNPRLLAQLKAGQLSPEEHLDLHGMNALQAWQSLTIFMREAYMGHKRCLLLIPGRGKNSPDGYGVLREKVQSWLTQDPLKRVVLAFCTAQPRHGGAGALYVLLRKYKKSAGKILWERLPLDDDLL